MKGLPEFEMIRWMGPHCSDNWEEVVALWLHSPGAQFSDFQVEGLSGKTEVAPIEICRWEKAVGGVRTGELAQRWRTY